MRRYGPDFDSPVKHTVSARALRQAVDRGDDPIALILNGLASALARGDNRPARLRQVDGCVFELRLSTGPYEWDYEAAGRWLIHNADGPHAAQLLRQANAGCLMPSAQT